MKNLVILSLVVLVYTIPVNGQEQQTQEIISSKPTIESSPSTYERYGDRIEFLGIKIKDPLVLCQVLIAIFLAIAFIQSGLDKIIDRQGNLDFFDEHFAKSPLRSVTSIALSVLTVMELGGGLLCLFGAFYALIEKNTIYIFYGLLVIALTLLTLFFGQRVTKDYIGAAHLVPYFIITMIAIMSMY